MNRNAETALKAVRDHAETIAALEKRVHGLMQAGGATAAAERDLLRLGKLTGEMDGRYNDDDCPLCQSCFRVAVDRLCARIDRARPNEVAFVFMGGMRAFGEVAAAVDTVREVDGYRP